MCYLTRNIEMDTPLKMCPRTNDCLNRVHNVHISKCIAWMYKWLNVKIFVTLYILYHVIIFYPIIIIQFRTEKPWDKVNTALLCLNSYAAFSIQAHTQTHTEYTVNVHTILIKLCMSKW